MLVEDGVLPVTADPDVQYEPPEEEGPTKYERFVSILKQFHSVKWINQYFDLLKNLLEDLGVESDDPRLAMTLTGKSLPVNLGQWYILKPYADQQIGIIVPEWFEEETVKGEVVFYFTHNEEVDAKFITVDFPIGKLLPKILYKACIEACNDIRRRSKKSGFRKHHLTMLYDFTVEQDVRELILEEVKTESV
jgi:hypothetical protein